MPPGKILYIVIDKNNIVYLKGFFKLIFVLLIILFFYATNTLKVNPKKIFIEKEKVNLLNEFNIDSNWKNINNNTNSFNNCYIPLNNANISIIHLIITRFFIEFYGLFGFPKKLFRKDYIPNGIRVMKKYLFPSLENQRCKNFIWILMLGDKVNITYVKSLLNLDYSFASKIIYQKDIKNYTSNIAKGFDILITTRIDYDDCIYYDAVNDARKAINMTRPIFLYGYNKGVYYFESSNKYYDFFYDNKDGVWSVFVSLIIIIKKVNNTLTIYDLGDHSYIKRNLLKSYKTYGIKELDYNPSIFENKEPQFIYVRQELSGSYNGTFKSKKNLRECNFNLSKFFGQ